MPIRPELRPLYRTVAWLRARARVFARAGACFDLFGEYLGGAMCERCERADGESYVNSDGRPVVVQLGCAHLDHEDLERFYDERNLKCLCRACHLITDLEFHRRTRQANKDRKRPLLVSAAMITLRLAIRGFVNGVKQFEDRVDVNRLSLDTLIDEAATKHADMIAGAELWRIEIEFLDEPDELARYFRFGTDRTGMVLPIAIEL
jgi:hypothetical protein